MESEEIHEFPSGEPPGAGVPVVLEACQQVMGIVQDLVGFQTGGVIKGPEGASGRASGVELRIEIGDATRRQVADQEIRVAGSLGFARGGQGPGAFKLRELIDRFAQGGLEVNADLIDARLGAGGAVRLIEPDQGCIEGGAEGGQDGLGRRIFWIEAQHGPAGGQPDDLAEGNLFLAGWGQDGVKDLFQGIGRGSG